MDFLKKFNGLKVVFSSILTFIKGLFEPKPTAKQISEIHETLIIFFNKLEELELSIGKFKASVKEEVGYIRQEVADRTHKIGRSMENLDTKITNTPGLQKLMPNILDRLDSMESNQRKAATKDVETLLNVWNQLEEQSKKKTKKTKTKTKKKAGK